MINVTINRRSFARNLARSQDFLVNKTKLLVKKVSYDIRDTARVTAPVDTGRLRNSIRVYLDSSGLSSNISTSVKYARFVEYGTGMYNSQGGGRRTPWRYWNKSLNKYVWTWGQRPKFFMRKGFEYATRDSNLERIAKGVFRWR